MNLVPSSPCNKRNAFACAIPNDLVDVTLPLGDLLCHYRRRKINPVIFAQSLVMIETLKGNNVVLFA